MTRATAIQLSIVNAWAADCHARCPAPRDVAGDRVGAAKDTTAVQQATAACRARL